MLNDPHESEAASLTEFDQLKKDFIPGYTLMEQVGKGASGVVFRAAENNTGRVVAIKVFYLHLCKNKDFVRSLIREARMLIGISHPNIVAGLDQGQYDGYYYTVMEFVEGGTLAHLLKKMGRLPEKEAFEMTLQVAQALDAAHKHQIIHRDIKPANIIITGDCIVKLTDFGLAKEEVDTSLTMPGAMLGTPLYVSPEQARGEHNVDIRSDIYALGITLYACLTGKPPFTGLNTGVLLTRKITDEIPNPRFANSDISPEAAAIIMKMCRKDRDLRYSCPAEVIRVITQHLNGEFEASSTLVKAPKPESVVSTEEIETILEKELHNEPLKRLFREKSRMIRPRLLEESDILFYEEDSSRDAYILIKGEMEVLKAGRRVNMINTAGAFLGEMSTLLQVRRTATLRSTQRTILLEISEATFLDFLSEAPEMALHLAKSLAARLQSTTDRLKDAQGRLINVREHYRYIKDELEGI